MKAANGERESSDRGNKVDEQSRTAIGRKGSSVEWGSVISRGTTGAREKHFLGLHRVY